MLISYKLYFFLYVLPQQYGQGGLLHSLIWTKKQSARLPISWDQQMYSCATSGLLNTFQ